VDFLHRRQGTGRKFWSRGDSSGAPKALLRAGWSKSDIKVDKEVTDQRIMAAPGGSVAKRFPGQAARRARPVCGFVVEGCRKQVKDGPAQADRRKGCKVGSRLSSLQAAAAAIRCYVMTCRFSAGSPGPGRRSGTQARGPGRVAESGPSIKRRQDGTPDIRGTG